MIKCPRCKLPQEETPQCQYCGFSFDENRKSAQDTRAVHRNRIKLFAVILLVVVCAVFASYWYISFQNEPKELTSVESTIDLNKHRSGDVDLRQTSKELSSYDGILNNLAGGSTKSGILAIVIFSIIGLGYLSYGKKSSRLWMVICGVALMAYPYFLNDTVYVILIGIALSLLPFILSRK
jgi:hypothetical protein